MPLSPSRLKRRILADLLASGFDLSKPGSLGVSVRCSQCAALVIQGVPCHEPTCPNKLGPRAQNDQEED
jgi:hypothetical protein